MDPIKVALREVRHTINADVLASTFTKPAYLNNIENAIIELVLRDRVIPDTGLYGYNIINIPITYAELFDSDNNSFTLHYPLQVLDGREIVGVYGIYDVRTIIPPPVSTGGSLMGAMTFAGNVTDSVPPLFNTQTFIRAKNTIGVYGLRYINDPAHILRVNLASTNDLQALTPKAFKLFTKMAVLAVKAYCYVQNSGQSSLGPDYGLGGTTIVHDLISEYSSANEEYEELRENQWGKVMLMEDGHTHSKLISMQLAPDL